MRDFRKKTKKFKFQTVEDMVERKEIRKRMEGTGERKSAEKNQ